MFGTLLVNSSNLYNLISVVTAGGTMERSRLSQKQFVGIKMSVAEENIPSPRNGAYSQRFSNELNILSIDHCYAKPWSSHPEASNARPLHMLFMERFPRSSALDKHRSTDIINVVDNIDEISHPYDTSKISMNECEKLTSLLPPEYLENKEDWEEHISSVRTTWSVQQNRNFAKVMRILQADRLAKLSISGIKNEQFQRRLQIDKAAKRVRCAFANVGWNMTVILWLHNLFLENLRGQLLTSYLEILQILKMKISSLVDRLIQGTNPNLTFFNTESLSGILKRNWDPALSSINQHKLKKLPENPLLLLIPNTAATSPNLMTIKRHKFWHSQLSAMGKVITLAPFSTNQNLSIVTSLENMITNARAKILEIKSHFPGRPIILIGWQVGALIAIHISSMEVVHGIICLGFPTMGISGSRGEIDDSIYNCRTPTLFVVGQNASSCSVDLLEDIRERLRIETELVLIGGADDHLRMSRAKKQCYSVTQTMVDRCIMDEMYQFLCLILSQANTQSEIMDEVEVSKKQRKRKHKEITSTAGSQTTGGEPKQVNPKPVKAIKLAKAVGYTGQLVLSGQITKKSPKKKFSDGAGSKHLLTSFTSTERLKSLSKVSEAEAIASAPELSSLLQNIKTQNQVKPASNTVTPILYAPSFPTNIPSSTAVTLSKFLHSSGLSRAGTVVKCSTTSKEAEKNVSCGLDTEKQHETQVKQPQILLRAGTSSSPISIPLTLSMANKVLKATPMMKITGSNPSSAQIQQLFSTFTNSSSSVLVSSGSVTHHQNSVLSTSSSILSPVVTVKPEVMETRPGLSNCSSSSGTPVSSATDLVKDPSAPPSSVPCTVSIDLGQISQAVPSTQGVMKFVSTTSKISLISNMKQYKDVSAEKASRPTAELLTSTSPVVHPKPQQICSDSSPAQSSSLQLSPSTGIFSFKSSTLTDTENGKNEDQPTRTVQNLSFSTNTTVTCARSKTDNDSSLPQPKKSGFTSLSSNSATHHLSTHITTSTHVTAQTSTTSTDSGSGVVVSETRQCDSDKTASRPVHSSWTPMHTKAAKSTISSYTATPKTVISTTSSTRTRTIRTPKQYDL
ncbi:KAT8 regulatory NSL complex subunit 3 [Bulinus truncatus]|nr:KAT8 regulatory NSL complex subunit 3 [Bulinus truncatus]